MKTKQVFFGYVLWLAAGGTGLWYVQKPWHLPVGILAVLGLFALPDWISGNYSGRFLKNDAARFEWAKIQFVAWSTVLIGGLLAMGTIRLKAGIMNPLSLTVDGTVALLLGTSALVLLPQALRGPAVDGIRKRAKKEIKLPQPVLFHTVFFFLTLVFVLSQAYLLWTTLRTTVPALLANYPTVSWGFALIYLVAGLSVVIVDLWEAFETIGIIKLE